MRKVKLLLVHAPNAEEAWQLLGDAAGLFGDNGGDPDGNCYLRPLADFEPPSVQRLSAAGLAVVVDGYEADYPAARWHVRPAGARRWCGYQIEEKVYFLDD